MKRTIIILTILGAGALTALAQENRPPRGDGPPSPEKLAARLIAEFDADGSGALDQAELAKALESMRERRPQHPGGHRPGEGMPPMPPPPPPPPPPENN